MLKKFEHILCLYNRYSWKIIVSIFYPVYWSQDINFINEGYDIITIFDESTSWLRGTYWKWNDFNNV